MNKAEHLDLINETINKTKEQIRPLSVNFIFWGILIILMSFIHYSFPSIIQIKTYSSLLFWTLLPLIGMIITIFYNKKIRDTRGYDTHLSRVIKIIWIVFNLSWLIIVVNSLLIKQNPVLDILFLLGITTLITGLIIRYKPVSFGGIYLMILYLLVSINPDFDILIINILGMLFGMVIPGILLFFEKKEESIFG
tara:strand:+ start:214 stop:795 length:582 start_codon:yes stop_codon:yes gene_type:complete